MIRLKEKLMCKFQDDYAKTRSTWYVSCLDLLPYMLSRWGSIGVMEFDN